MDSEISDFEEDVILPNSPLGQYLSEFTASEKNDSSEYCELSVKNISNNSKKGHDIYNKVTNHIPKIFSFVKLYFDYLYSAFVPSVRLFEYYDLKNILKNSNFNKVLLPEDNLILQNYEADENITRELGLSYATVFYQIFQLVGFVLIYFILKSVISINNIDSYLIHKLSDNLYFLYASLKIILSFVPMLFLINIFIIIVFVITNIIEFLFCKNLCHSVKKKLQRTENIIITIKKCIRLIQEAELIARGFTYASIPGIVERLELSTGLPITLSQKQYPELRKHIFSWSRNIFLLYRSRTQFLIESKIIGPPLDISSQSLAQLNLKEFGDLLKYNIDLDSNMQELLKLTDNLSVSSLKTIYFLAEFQISEFFKYLYLITSFVVIDDDLFNFAKRIKHFYTLNSSLNYLHSKQSDIFKLACKMYKYYRSIEMLSDVEDRSMIPLKLNSPLEINIHNMSLHIKAALRKLTTLEELFENENYSNELYKEELLRKVEVISKQIKSEIDAYNDYYKKCNSEIQNILYDAKEQSINTSVSDESSKNYDNTETIIISQCDIEPDIEDEIFEAIATKSASIEDCQVFPTGVNKNIEITGKLLHELKNVLIVKADEHHRREEIALAKRFNKELQTNSSLSNNTSNEDKSNEVEPYLSKDMENPNISTPLLDTENSPINSKCTYEESRKMLSNNLQFKIASTTDNSFSASVAALALHRQKLLGISNDTCFSDENTNSDDDELI